AWFGPVPDIDAPGPVLYAARGDRSEMLSRKGAVNGYAALGANLRLLPGNVTPGPGAGTVSDIRFSFPDDFGEIAPATSAAVSYTLTWNNVPDNTWFGIYASSHGLSQPEFQTDQ